jgi:hypothetical protein
MDGFLITQGVSSEPLTISDLTANGVNWLRIDFPDDDPLIASLITQCRSYAESVTRRSLAVKTYQAILKLDPVPAGRLSGPVDSISDPLLYAERITFSPFGTTPFVLELPFPPCSSVTTLEYQITPFDVPQWTSLPQLDGNGNPAWTLDSTGDPAMIYFAQPIAASRFRVTFVAGYQSGFKTVPDDLLMTLKQLIAWRYGNRDGEAWPTQLTSDLLNYRVEYSA